MNRAELLAALEQRQDEVSTYFLDLKPARFTAGTQQRWSPAHHLDHLVRSNTPVALGLGAYRERFTTPCDPRAARSYEELRDTYRNALARARAQGVATATGRFVPEPSGDQAAQLKQYRESLDTLRAALQSWEDTELDASTMPHPLLGDLTIREMLLFTLYHNEHHLSGVKTRVEAE